MSEADNSGVSSHKIDPTKNVLDLVRAEGKYQDFAREAIAERANDLMAAETLRVDQMIRAEADKSTALRAQRDVYEARMDSMQADYAKQIASILERQTDKSASVLADAVNKATERLAVVEKNQYTSGGQTSVRDPAVSSDLAAIKGTLEALSKSGSKTEGKTEGFSQIGAIVLGVCTVIATIIAAAVFVVSKG